MIAFLVLALALVGVGLAIAGVYLLAGLAWALIAAGAALVGLAELLRRGMTPNG